MTKIISGAIFGSIAAVSLAAMPASAGGYVYNNSNCSGTGHSNVPAYYVPAQLPPKAFFSPIKGPGRAVVVIPKKAVFFRGFRSGYGMW